MTLSRPMQTEVFKYVCMHIYIYMYNIYIYIHRCTRLWLIPVLLGARAGCHHEKTHWDYPRDLICHLRGRRASKNGEAQMDAQLSPECLKKQHGFVSWDMEPPHGYFPSSFPFKQARQGYLQEDTLYAHAVLREMI